MTNAKVGTVIELPERQNTQEQTLHIFNGPRGIAARILSRAESSDSYIERMIDHELRDNNEWTHYDKSLLIELVYGTLRWQNRLDWILTGFYHGEFSKCITPVKNAMRIALYQLMMLSKIPPSVAIGEAATLIKRVKDEKSGNVVTAVLKNILRNLDNIRYPNKDDNIQLFYSVTLSHPMWMVRRWCERYGDELAEKILSGNNERPAVQLRVNQTRSTLEYVEHWLRERDISFEQSPFSKLYLRINGLQQVEFMDIYHQGFVSRTDASNQLVVQLAALQDGMTVINLGTPVGTKAFASAEALHNKGRVIALAKFDEQLNYLRRHATRLGLTCFEGIAASSFTEKNVADVVMAEARSSEVGLLQRKPELKWQNELDSVKRHVKSQRALLTEAVSLVKKNGVVIYIVPSHEPEESSEQVAWFLENFPNFILENAEGFLPADVVENNVMKLHPHIHKTDGVFAVRFKRTS
ncbi:MAG: hypothetical protein JNL32_06700 [Candidatus Kapabacteria bacterium]|nr:hypothetical protein [Candidatus Kapabacteria bacterium]